MISPISVKGKLANVAHTDHRLFSEVLVSYAIERLLYRLSVSQYSELFVLKGGVLLYGLFDSKYPRSTSDIDFLGLIQEHTEISIQAIFEDLLSIQCDDAIFYDLASLSVHKIAAFTDNPGLRVKCLAYLDKTRITVSLDIGFSDVIYPKANELNFPTLLKMDSPKLLVYPIESVISEKFHAIAVLGKVNSRFKDFYDIGYLSRSFNFHGEDLKEALSQTFINRNTGFENIPAFDPDFIQDNIKRSQWKGFLNKKNIDDNIEFSELIMRLKTFLVPVIQSLCDHQDFDLEWSCETLNWS